MTKNIFTTIFQWIVNCYDNSIFEKIMQNIFGFFKGRSENSIIVNFFKNHFSNGNMWNKSKSAKIVRGPFKLSREFYHRHEERIKNRRNNSKILTLLSQMGDISLRDYGIMLAFLGIGIIVGLMVFSKLKHIIDLGIGALMLVVGGYFALTKSSINQLSESSRVIVFFKEMIAYNEPVIKKEPVRLSGVWLISIVALIFGVISAYVGTSEVLVGVLLAKLVVLILWKTQIGVFLFVPLSAILPTMALAGLVMLTFVSFILHLLYDKKGEYVSTPFQPWILVFMGLLCYATFTGVNVRGSVPVLMIYIIFTIAYVLVVNVIKTRPQWTALVIAFVVAAFGVALYGIYQNFFLVTTENSWVDGEMFTEIKKRVYATLDNPNVLGQYFIMLLPIAVGLLIKMKGAFKKALYTIGCFIMFLCLIYTWSRGAWIGTLLGIVFFIILKDRRWLCICIAGLLLAPSVLPASIIDRITSIGNVNDSSTAYRVAIWTGSMRMIKDFWLTGIGLGSDAFLSVYPRYALGGAEFALHSHNFYMQWIVDLGIMGIFVYIGIVLTGFIKIFSVKEKDSLVKNILLAMSGAFLGYLFQGVAENLWYNYRMILLFWVYLGILQSGVMISDEGIQRKDVIK